MDLPSKALFIANDIWIDKLEIVRVCVTNITYWTVSTAKKWCQLKSRTKIVGNVQWLEKNKKLWWTWGNKSQSTLETWHYTQKTPTFSFHDRSEVQFYVENYKCIRQIKKTNEGRRMTLLSCVTWQFDECDSDFRFNLRDGIKKRRRMFGKKEETIPTSMMTNLGVLWINLGKKHIFHWVFYLLLPWYRSSFLSRTVLLLRHFFFTSWWNRATWLSMISFFLLSTNTSTVTLVVVQTAIGNRNTENFRTLSYGNAKGNWTNRWIHLGEICCNELWLFKISTLHACHTWKRIQYTRGTIYTASTDTRDVDDSSDIIRIIYANVYADVPLVFYSHFSNYLRVNFV